MIEFTWKNIETDVNTLVEELKTHYFPFDVVIGIANGGIIPAVLVAKKLGIENIRILYKGETVDSIQSLFDIYSNPLIIDDINDTGKTIYNLAMISDHITFGTLHRKENNTMLPTIPCGLSIDFDEWIKYPWENYDEIQKNNSGAD